MAYKKLVDTTDDPQQYKKAYRIYIADKYMRCSICLPHRSENRINRGRDSRSWKTYRKTQYKVMK